MTEFDASQAILRNTDIRAATWFDLSRSLREGLASGAIRSDAAVLVMKREAGIVALLIREVSRYHICQGDLAGQPWLIAF